ncbi:MAG: thioredoxin family protein, partial [Odoribacteraceae bacterium]|nr:thioredoxin family protein [Odoribacteraceae bacterium]
MKTRILLLLALLPALVAGQGVNFRDIPLDSALLAAAREGKHLFIDGYTAWCGPCKLMDNEIFPLQVLGDYFNPRFVSVKYDMERHPDGVALAARFGVKAYPTFIILDSTNQLLHLFAGGVLGPEFIDKVNDAFDDDKAFGTLSRRLASNPDDAALRVRHLQALQATYTRDVSGLADTLWASLSPDERLHPACLFLLDDLAPDGSPRARYLFQHLEEYRSSSTPAAVDAILKKKYIERYTRVLRGQRPLAPDWLDLTRRQIDSLHLTGAAILRLYDQAL